LLSGKYLFEEKAEGRLANITPHMKGFLDAAYHYTEWFGPDTVEKTK